MDKELLKVLEYYGFKRETVIPINEVEVRRRFEEERRGLRNFLLVRGEGKKLPPLGKHYRWRYLGHGYFLVWEVKEKQTYIKEPGLW